MVKALIGALALSALPCSLAFKNTSPFFVFSTLPYELSDASVASSEDVMRETIRAIEDCRAHTYILVRQDGISTEDLRDTRTTPRLAHYLSGQREDIKSTKVVSEVYGELDFNSDFLEQHLETRCGTEQPLKIDWQNGEIPKASGSSKRIIEVTFPEPAAASRAATFERNDSILDDIITTSVGSQDYTVIYMTSPPSREQEPASEKAQQTYQMETPFDEAVHMELKRDVGAHAKRAEEKKGGLFERYQFFTPGIFMGFVAVVPLFLVLYVGGTALAGLEVSYFAFSKEMGPAGRTKQG